MLRNILIAFAVALSLLPFVGCGPSKKVKYRIAVIPKGQTHEFWQSIERGSRAAAADLTAKGISTEIVWDAPLKESDAEDQINFVRRNATSRVNGIVLAPQDSKRMIPVVEEAVKGGVPVVVIDSALAKPDLIVKYVATDNENGGRMAADHLLATLARQNKPAPKLVLFRYQPGSESTDMREKGFMDRVKEEIKKQQDAGEPTIEVISDNVYAGADVPSAQANAGPLLARLSDKIDGLFAVNESATTGMLNAMRTQKLIGKFALMGFDSSEPLRRAVAKGEVCGLIVQDPYRMGYTGVWTLVRHLEGDDVSGGGPKKQIPTGEHLVTSDNITEEKIRWFFEPELQKKRTIELPKFKRE